MLERHHAVIRDAMSEPAATSAAQAVLVLGMHRGGTSALSGLLHLLGFEHGPSLMPAAEGVNNKGFWEHSEAFAIHERLFAALGRSRFDPREMPLGWRDHVAFGAAVDEVRALVLRDFREARLWAVKDPRMCRLVPVWLEALASLGIRPHVILVARHPAEVARSMQAQGWISSSARAHLCWLQHMLEAEQATRHMPRTLLRYEALLEDWRTAIARIGNELELEWRPASVQRDAAIDAFLDPRERRHVESDETVTIGREPPPLALELFDACREPDSESAWRRIAEIGDVYRRAAAAFGPCLDEAIVEASLAHLEVGEGRSAAVGGDASLLDAFVKLRERSEVLGVELRDLARAQEAGTAALAASAARHGDIDVSLGALSAHARQQVDAQARIAQEVAALATAMSASARRQNDDIAKLETAIRQLRDELGRHGSGDAPVGRIWRLLGGRKPS